MFSKPQNFQSNDMTYHKGGAHVEGDYAGYLPLVGNGSGVHGEYTLRRAAMNAVRGVADDEVVDGGFDTQVRTEVIRGTGRRLTGYRCAADTRVRARPARRRS